MKKDDIRKKFIWFIAISLILHILFALFFQKGLAPRKTDEESQKPLFINLNQKKKPRKIADIQKPKKESVPKNATAEALYSQSAENETVAAKTNPNPGAPISAPQPQQEQPKQQPTPNTEKKLSDVFNERAEEAKKKEEVKQTIDSFQRGLGAGTPDDILPDYKVGNRTYINTLANPAIGYYVELKRKFRLAFNPVQALRGRVNTSMRGGQMSVVLGVTVNARGELTDLIIIRSSGMPTYDDEGRRTVRSSAPFSAPPASLIQSNGQLDMAWTFIVYL